MEACVSVPVPGMREISSYIQLRPCSRKDLSRVPAAADESRPTFPYMKQIFFTIYGTPEDLNANAIPKLKMTGGQKWTVAARRYSAWKQYIQSALLDSLNKHHGEDAYSLAGNRMVTAKKPLLVERGMKARMEIEIFWNCELEGRHPDPENVFGSIADALFINDKNLDGAFTSAKAPDWKPRVDVLISFNE